jgi:predicted RNA binding protein YcfA (HicA-like mRNA interferase family)
MSGQYPLLNRKQIIDILRSADFKEVRTESSHAQWEGYTHGERRIVTVKKLKSDSELYSDVLLKSMIRQSGLSKKAFYKYLGR